VRKCPTVGKKKKKKRKTFCLVEKEKGKKIL
jgi:hypothetical protein